MEARLELSDGSEKTVTGITLVEETSAGVFVADEDHDTKSASQTQQRFDGAELIEVQDAETIGYVNGSEEITESAVQAEQTADRVVEVHLPNGVIERDGVLDRAYTYEV